MKKDNACFFVVVYDDDDCVQLPTAFDKDCEGALTCISDGQDVAAFEDMASAKTAIRITTAYARLRKLQGKPANDDFDKKNLGKVKIVCCCVDPAKEAGGK